MPKMVRTLGVKTPANVPKRPLAVTADCFLLIKEVRLNEVEARLSTIYHERPEHANCRYFCEEMGRRHAKKKTQRCRDVRAQSFHGNG
jgi:hypothetical protein